MTNESPFLGDLSNLIKIARELIKEDSPLITALKEAKARNASDHEQKLILVSSMLMPALNMLAFLSKQIMDEEVFNQLPMEAKVDFVSSLGAHHILTSIPEETDPLDAAYLLCSIAVEGLSVVEDLFSKEKNSPIIMNS